jgi:hypothetical protein
MISTAVTMLAIPAQETRLPGAGLVVRPRRQQGQTGLPGTRSALDSAPWELLL